MCSIRQARERGRSQTPWLDSRHSFSFADYYDPMHMGFSVLRVVNEDHVAPGAGFPMHGHRDMEIISYVLEGTMEHRDTLGNGSILRAGDVQRMSAGSGIRHSEFNASGTESLTFLQIWMQPERAGILPGYEQKCLFADGGRDELRLAVSPDGRYDSLTIHQDAFLYIGRISGGTVVTQCLDTGRRGYLHVARGVAKVNGHLLHGGDAMTFENDPAVIVDAVSDSEVLLFDLP
jgi:hypothetical protein